MTDDIRTAATPKPPIRFDPALETVAGHEDEAIESLENGFREILETTSSDYGRAVRGVHAKAHALVRGTLTVADGLPPELAQGVFGKPGSHAALLRISTAPGDIMHDSVSAPRGAALKLLDVEGTRLEGSEDERSQDFLMINGPVFGTADTRSFARNIKMLAKTTDRAEGAKKLLSATLRTVESGLEALGGESILVKQLGGAPEVHPLGETYFTQTAYRYGDHVAKLSLVPVSPWLLEVAGEIVDTKGRPDALREEIAALLPARGGRWSLRVQLCTDAEAMPIEDPTVEWDQAESPFREVAVLDIPPQPSWTPGTSEGEEDALSFAPWRGLEAHRPLGQVNRARKPVYRFSREFRAEFNGCPIMEPAAEV